MKRLGQNETIYVNQKHHNSDKFSSKKAGEHCKGLAVPAWPGRKQCKARKSQSASPWTWLYEQNKSLRPFGASSHL